MTEYNRRHELPESEDDLKALFDELTGPLAEQSRDRLMTDIVNSASWVELQLNDGPEVSDDTFTESLAVLNGDLEGNGVLGEQLIVTGKLRPVLADSIAAEGGTIMDIELPPSISKYGELKRDDEGPYLEVADCELTCGQFAVLAKRGVHFSDASREYQGIILKLGLQPDEESQTLPFYSYLDDIARIEPKEPSFLKIYEMFDNDYPEIAEQLNELPADIRNDQHIVGALASFCLEIDWAKYPRHDEDERQALLEHIETYITNRVNFDTETYEMWVYDYLYGVNKDNEQTVIEQPEEKRLAVVVNHVRLEEVETEGKVQRFAVMIEVQASARGHGNGRYRLYIPAANISGIRNLRNNSFRPKGLEITSEEEMFVDDIPVEGAAAIKQAIEQAAGTEAPRSKEQDLIELDMLYKEMLARISVYTARRYSTIKEAREANIAISRILNAFRAAYPAHGVAIEASGPGVIAVNAHWDTDTDFTFDKETGIATIKLHNANTQVGDDLALQRGVFTNSFKGVIDYDVDADDTYFAMGRDEIELFTTDEPSTEMVAEILERDYPDIYDALRAIPKGEDDIAKLLKALDKFKLYIDWTAYPHQHEEDLAVLEAMIGEYLTDRIGLDGGLYKLKVKGCLVIIELTENGPAPYFMPIKDPLTIRGYVQGFHLFERANPKDVPEEVSTYELKLRVLARIHGGGNQDIEIPISSLIKLKSLSNDLLLPSALKAAEEDHFEQIIAIDRSTIEPQSSARTDATLVYSTNTPATQPRSIDLFLNNTPSSV